MSRNVHINGSSYLINITFSKSCRASQMATFTGLARANTLPSNGESPTGMLPIAHLYPQAARLSDASSHFDV